MNKFYTLLIIGLLSAKLAAQTEQTALIGQPDFNKMLIICIAQDSVFEETKIALEAYKGKPVSFYLLNGTELNPERLKDSLNYLFNRKEIKIDKQYVYQIIIGEDAFFHEHNVMERDIFADSRFLRVGPQNGPPSKTKTEDYASVDWVKLVEELSEEYTSQRMADEIRVLNKEYKYTKDGTKYKTLRLSRVLPQLYNTTADQPDDFTALTYESRKKLKGNFEFSTSLSLGWKTPNPQDDIMSQVQSQIDISSILAGEGEEQEIDISTTIKAHGYASLGLQGRYVWDNPELQPYAGLGLSYTVYAGLAVPIDTTLVIDFSEGFSGGGFGDAERPEFDRGDLRDGENTNLIGRVGIPLTLGVYRKMNESERWSLDFHATYDLDPRSFGNSKQAMNNLSLGIGVSLRILGKKSSFYNYFRHKKKQVLLP